MKTLIGDNRAPGGCERKIYSCGLGEGGRKEEQEILIGQFAANPLLDKSASVVTSA